MNSWFHFASKGLQLLVAAALLLTSVPVSPARATAHVAQLSAAGGRFISEDGRLRIDFSPGALRASTNVAARIHVQHTALQGQVERGRSEMASRSGALLHFTLEARDRQTNQTVEELEKSVRLTVDLRGLIGEDGLLAGQHLYLIYLADPVTNEWREAPVTFDPQMGLLTARVNLLSPNWEIGAVGEGWKPILTPPVPDLFSGAVIYHHPIQVPPGRNGLQPAVTISYNSRRVDGLIDGIGRSVDGGPIALGWSVGGAAEVVRRHEFKACGEYHCLHLYDDFSLVLNGVSHELVPDVEGQVCGRYRARNAPGLYVERRNAACGNGSPHNETTDYWIVRQADGTELRLGYTENSEAVTGQANGGLAKCSGFCAPNDNPRFGAARSRVDSITDAMGNRMRFTYREKDIHPGPLASWAQRSILRKIRYNNYYENGELKWMSEVSFVPASNDSDDKGYMRIKRMEVWNAGERIRQYKLTVNKKWWHACGQSHSERALLKIQEFSGDGSASLPPVEFQYVGLQNFRGSTDGVGCFTFRRVSKVHNGYGGRTEFSYEHDGRTSDGCWPSAGCLPEYGYSYRVREMRTYDGMDADPAKVTYDYGTRCYDQKRGDKTNGGALCRGDHAEDIGPLVGHDRVTETAFDYDDTRIVKTRHRYYIDDNDSWKRGREWQAQVYSGQNERLRQTDITWANRGNGRTAFAYVSQVVTTDYSGGEAVSTRVEYEYDDYGNVVTEYYYNAAGTTARLIDRGFRPNTDPNVWIVNKPAYERVLGPGPVTPQKKTETRYYYDGSGDYQASPTKGALTRIDRGREDWGWVTTFYAYDDWGNLTNTWDPLGNHSTIEYDTTYHQFPVQTWNALEHCSITEYYGAGEEHGLPGQVKAVTDPNGATAEYRYDEFGRPTAIRAPDDEGWGDYQVSTRFAYHFLGQIGRQHVAVYSGRNTTWQAEYFDGLGRTIQVHQKADGEQAIRTTTGYDALGRAVKSWAPHFGPKDEDGGYGTWGYVPPAGDVPYTTTTYDALGRVKRVTEPDGTETRHYYAVDKTTDVVPNGTGLWKHATVDGNGHAKHYIQDALGQLVVVRELEGTCQAGPPDCDVAWTLYAETHYAYDVLGNLTDVWDDAENHTHMEYDPLSRKTEMDDPDMGRWAYDYDDAGNLEVQTDARGCVITFIYDELQRLTGKTYSGACAGAPEVSYTYDQGDNGIGRRTGMSDRSGSTAWRYDARGRMTREDKTINGAGAFTTQYTYDAMDRVVDMTYPDGEVVHHDYNNAGSLESLTAGADALVSDAVYNALGQITALPLGNGLTTEYTYDPLTFRLNRLQVRGLLDLRYTYDPVGNVKTITDLSIGGQVQFGQTQYFTYDHLDRLTHAWTTSGAQGAYDRSYGYNEIGNITYKSDLGAYTYPASGPGSVRPHAVTSVSALASDGQPYTYDIVEDRFAADGSSGFTPGCDLQCPYCIDLKQCKCVPCSDDPPPDPPPSVEQATYTYDANGNMTSRTENGVQYTQNFNAENKLETVTNAGTDETTTFTYDGDGNRVLRINPDGSKTAYVGGYFEVDFKGPDAPGDLVAAPLSRSEVQLTWTDNSDNEDGFRIERSPDRAGGWVEIAAVGADATSYSDGGLACETSYFYRVRAYNAVGYSGYSNTAAATTLACPTPPSAPGDLVATPLSRSQIGLTWTDNSDDEDGFRIERSPDGAGGWVEIAAVGADATSYSDGGLACETSYFYRVRAYNAVGYSGYSNTAAATTLACPTLPNAPSNLVAAPLSASQIRLTWTDNSSDEDGFKIERSLNKTVWSEIATVGANATSYTDPVCHLPDFRSGQAYNADAVGVSVLRAPAPMVVYYYRVRAYNAAGYSGYSNVSQCATEPCPVLPPGADEPGGGTYSRRVEPRLLPEVPAGFRDAGAANPVDERVASATAQASTPATPPNGQTWRSYYTFGSQRVAMRKDGELTYLHPDHLGSTSLATDANGQEVYGSRATYYPYGEMRTGSAAEMPTDYQYTGQRHDAYIDMYEMGARWYDPRIGRWISADTIVPDPANPQSFNRYSYVYNNPVRYTDPSGHLTEDELRQLLGDNYDYLMGLWEETDPYFYDVILGEELQSGDFLEASMLEGRLLFQEVDGVMRVFAHDRATSTNLWDWQGKGFYTIHKPGTSDREAAILADQMFSASMNEYSNPLYAFYYQPMFSYSIDSAGQSLAVEYTGLRVLERYTTIHWSGVVNLMTGDRVAPGIDFAIDGGLAVSGVATLATPLAAAGPPLAWAGLGKFVLDLGATGYKTFADPVYHYR